MPVIRADMDASNFSLLPAGTYGATIAQFKRKTVTNKEKKNFGATLIGVMFKVHSGGSVWTNCVIAPDSIWSFKQIAEAAGYPKEELSGNKDVGYRDEFEDGDDMSNALIIDDVLAAIVNQDVTIKVTVRKEDPDNGWPAQNNVQRVLPYTGESDEGDGGGWDS